MHDPLSYNNLKCFTIFKPNEVCESGIHVSSVNKQMVRMSRWAAALQKVNRTLKHGSEIRFFLSRFKIILKSVTNPAEVRHNALIVVITSIMWNVGVVLPILY